MKSVNLVLTLALFLMVIWSIEDLINTNFTAWLVGNAVSVVDSFK